MSTLYLGNFAFEETLLTGGAVSAVLRRIEAERACVWLGVVQPGDAILCPLRPEDEYLERMRALGLGGVRIATPDEVGGLAATDLVAWGPTGESRRLAAKYRLRYEVPPEPVVRRVNSREYQFKLCSQLGCGLKEEGVLVAEGDGASEDLEAVRARTSAALRTSTSDVVGASHGSRPVHAVDPPAGPLPEKGGGGVSSSGEDSRVGGWLLKGNLGFSGRDQRRIAGGLPGEEIRLSAADAQWIARTLRRTGAVAVEPFLESVSQLSSQWSLPDSGPPELLGVTQLLTDERGAHVGNSTQVADVAAPFVDALLQWHRWVAEEVWREGYFGPLGIDAMVYEGPEGKQLRPVQDINARWTMGRVTLEWSRRFAEIGGAGEGTLWMNETAAGSAAILVSPRMIGGTAVRSGVWWG